MSALESWTRLYRLLLRAYPPDFRRRHGAAMERVFRQQLRRARRRPGATRVPRLLLQALWDVARNAAQERAGRWPLLARHLDARHPAGPGPVTRPSGQRARPRPGASVSRLHHAPRAPRDPGGMTEVMESLVQDLRYAFRTLRRSPTFTVVAVLTIALAIGANTAMFSVARAVILRPLPYDDPGRLMLVWGELQNRGQSGFPTAAPTYRDLERETTVFEDLGAFFTYPSSLTWQGERPAEPIVLAATTAGFTSVLGVEPLLGRGLVAEDVVPGARTGASAIEAAPPRAALLTHALWQGAFGGDPGVVGRTVEIAGNPVEVVGVLPPDFRLLLPPGSGFDTDVDALVGLRLDYEAAPRGNVFLGVVGRLREGMGPAAARQELEGLAASLREGFPTYGSAGFAFELEPLHENLVEGSRAVIVALMAAVGFVLLIACANVANLLLVRGAGRSRELAVRAALGAGRVRLLRQALTESLVLGTAGGVLGLLAGHWANGLLLAFRPENLPRVEEVAVDGSVLAFTAGATLLATLLSGILPAVHLARRDLGHGLQRRGGASAGRSRRWFQSGLVVAEVTLCIVLLAGAGLMLRSLLELQRIDPGFDPEGVMTFRVTIPVSGYPEPEDRSLLARRLQEELAALPGVERASAVFPLPLGGRALAGRYGTEEAQADPTRFRTAAYRIVLPGYFRAMGTPLVEGRTFDETDNLQGLPHAVVDEKLAERTWPGESAVGRRLLVRLRAEPEWVEVVGVVRHQRSGSVAVEGTETVYFTDGFAAAARNTPRGALSLAWVLRTAGDPAGLAPAIRSVVAAFDPDLPVADLQPMSTYVEESMAAPRFGFVLIVAFGALAALLAAVGLYGVIASAVEQRTGEIGLRVALGAGPAAIRRLVLGHGLGLSLLGVALGVPAALAMSGLLGNLLVGVTAADPWTYGAIAVLFLAIAALACWVPARRAVRIDPMVALAADGVTDGARRTRRR